MLDRAAVDALFPSDLPDTDHWEQHYAQRQLPDGAKVTRLGPSPTGFIHIGGIYAGMIDRDVAHHSDGVYLLRVEDTDRSREIEGAVEQFDRAFATSASSPTRPTATAPTGRTCSRSDPRFTCPTCAT